ncbi:hypothetical protein, partial [Polyangium sp. 15x6]|uniref:hypothetical protein n=1 Tax=Polyangium sp. 15x6 TaxID=3042687 RepID=UPI00249BE7C5
VIVRLRRTRRAHAGAASMRVPRTWRLPWARMVVQTVVGEDLRRAIIHDQNGLFVADVVAADAELVTAAPILLGYLAGLLDDPLATIFDDLSNQEAIVAKLLKRDGMGAVEG